VTRHLLPPTYTRAAADLAEMTRAQLARDGVRVTRGAFVSRSVPLTTASAVRAALAVLPEGTVASHATAAVLLGAPLPASWPLEFAVRPGVYRARRQRIRVHVRDLTARDEVRGAGLPVTSGPQTWLDLAAHVPAQDLVVVGDALYRAGHLDAATLAERLDRADGVRGVVRARECAPLLTPLAASRPESLIRYWVVTAGLPVPTPQLPVVDRRGRTVAHADLGYEEWRIALEYEGRHHAERRQFRRDLDRYSLMAAHGWLVLRFGEDDLRRRDRVLSRVAGALESRGARW
jgi:hypothetical protein